MPGDSHAVQSEQAADADAGAPLGGALRLGLGASIALAILSVAVVTVGLRPARTCRVPTR